MARVAASTRGERGIRLLRIVRHGDRHDPRELTVALRFEGPFGNPDNPSEGAGGLAPGAALERLVQTAVRDYGGGELETVALGLCERMLNAHPSIALARVKLSERIWQRLDAGGRTQGQAFASTSAELKTAAVTQSGRRAAVVAGIEHLALMRSRGFAPPEEALDDGRSDGLPRLLVGSLAARWTYASSDVTFRPYRQGVRAALVESFTWYDGRSVEHLLHAMADVVLATYAEIVDVTLAFDERPYRPADPFSGGLDNPEDLFVAAEDPVGVIEVRVERTETQGNAER